MPSEDVEHPGMMLRRELAKRGWLQIELAEILRRPTSAINAICTGRRGISYRMAKELEAALQIPAIDWVTTWNAYLLAHVRPREARPKPRETVTISVTLFNEMREAWVGRYAEEGRTDG